MKKVRSGAHLFLLAVVVVLFVFLSAPQTGEGRERDVASSKPAVAKGSPAQAVDQPPGIARLLADSNGQAQVSISPVTGLAGFVRLPQPEGSTASSLLLPAAPSPRAAAEAFLHTYGAAFGIADAGSELRFVSERADFTGQTHVSYQQVYEGVEVFGGVLKVHLNQHNQVRAANGTFLPQRAPNTTPTITAAAAQATAVTLVTGQQEVADRSLSLSAADTHLYLFHTGLTRGIPGSIHLVYQVEVVNAGLSVREFVYVDAHTGKVLEQITGIHENLDRKVSEGSLANVIWEDSAGDPDPIPAGHAGGSAQQVTDWQNEIDGAAESYNLIASMTGGVYLSYDGADATMHTVNNDPGINCPNANWNGTSTNYCSDVTGDDTVAHEWGHAYTEYTNNLIYAWQSGALNEAYSDMWGEAVDLLNGRGADAPDVVRASNVCSSNVAGANYPGNPTVDTTRWLSGEDDPAFFGIPAGSGNAIRDMWDPTCFGDPGKVTDTAQYVCSTTDGGGVHTNSGIPNHAFALMVDGGTYNGQTVSAIGLTKTAHLHWAAQNMLTPASDFVDHADALESSCTALTGVNLPALSTSSTNAGLSGEIITVADCQEVADAIAAVEFRTEPTFCNFTPLLEPDAPALCEGQGSVQSIFSEDWEGGTLPAGWTAGSHDVANPATFDTPDWDVTGSLPSGAGSSYAAFVPNLVIGNCAADDESGALFLDSPVIPVPAGATVPLVAFDHWVATELGWDGGNVKISVNGNAWTLIPGSAFSFNAYKSSLESVGAGNTNPLASQSAFTGADGGANSGSWGQSQVDLSGFAGPGDTVRFRFDFGVDGCNGSIGWYVDEVQVYSCSAGGPAIIDVDDTTLSQLLDTDQSGSESLTIQNAGEADLNWTLAEETLAAGPAAESVLAAAAPALNGDRSTQDNSQTGSQTASLPAAAAVQAPAPRPLIDGDLSEGFDSVANLTGGGWAINNLSSPLGSASWFQGNPVSFIAQAGADNAYVGANFESASGAATISNWLLTPELTFRNGDTVSFWTRTPAASTWPDRLQVRMSTAGSSTDVGTTASSVGDFTTLLLDINPTLAVGGYPTTWTEYTLNISGLGGPTTGRIAFRYYVTNGGPLGSNSNYIGIDTFNYDSALDSGVCDTPEDIPWLSLSATSGTTPGGGSSLVDVTFDATGLASGVYNGTLCLQSNDAVTPLVTIPVELTVDACASQPALADSLAASAPNSSDLQLDWAGNAANLSYQLYGSSQPYFTSATGTWLADYPAGAGSHSATGVLADGSNSYYLLTSLNCNGSLSADSTIAGEFEFALTPGN